MQERLLMLADAHLKMSELLHHAANVRKLFEKLGDPEPPALARLLGERDDTKLETATKPEPPGME